MHSLRFPPSILHNSYVQDFNSKSAFKLKCNFKPPIDSRVCSSFVTFFTKFEFASSSQIVPIFVYFTAKIGTICEEDADSDFVKKVTKLEQTLAIQFVVSFKIELALKLENRL